MTSTPLIPPTTSPIRCVRDRWGEGVADVVKGLWDEVADEGAVVGPSDEVLDSGERDEELFCESFESVLYWGTQMSSVSRTTSNNARIKHIVKQ